ncbi:hypothetical protein LGQ02_01555 [Bacillus shivajii]|uniref:hypothetical protein n=1 Tax=Bacillus shivajii TaxID=1983719 RepID=UPI001CFBC8DE|nr:hypothetical protein [Bacillus shivajii]UCZ53513.1 hypothetical protein LGQ02_01555 [Bacillus shivajii]
MNSDDDYYSTLEAAINADTKGGINEVMHEDRDEKIVIFMFDRQDSESRVVTTATYKSKNNKFKKDVNEEVAMEIDGDAPDFQTKQFVHPDTEQNYLTGIVNRDEQVEKVEVHFTVSEVDDEVQVTTFTTDLLENQVFITPVYETFPNAEEVKYKLIGTDGEVIERYTNR